MNRPTRRIKILIVEDEAKTGDDLKQGLTEAGFVVNLARDGMGCVFEAPEFASR